MADPVNRVMYWDVADYVERSFSPANPAKAPNEVGAPR